MTPTESTDTGLEAVDTGVETVDTGIATEAQPENTSTEEAAPPAPIAEQTPPYRAVTEDGKRLDEKARATIDEIKAKDPALAREIRNALFEADRFRRALPGGLKEVQELRQTIENYGGPEALEGMQAEFKGWTEFDKQYMAGDPKALEFMLDTPEAQAGFLKIAPVAFNKFEELNPEGYASYLCQRIIGDAVANKVPISMELAQHYLAAGDATKAAEEFAKVVNWFRGLDATAQKPITPKEAPPPPPDSRIQELETQNLEQTRTIWMRDYAQEQNNLYNSELTRLLAGRNIPDAIRANILHAVSFKLEQRFKRDQANFDRYLKVRDQDGFQKYAKSFDSKNIPALLREAVDKFVAAKPGPKAQPPAPNGTPVRPPTAKPADGFQFVQQMPTRDQIDWDSPFTKIREGKAVTTDGKKVTWRKA